MRGCVFLLFILKSIYSLGTEITNVQFYSENNKIIVKYDLSDNDCKQNLFDISLTFMDESGSQIYPTSIIGDLNKVSCGKEKKISWDVLNDRKELKGSLKAIVSIYKKYKKQNMRGPSNALFSLLVPGLGLKRVTNGNHGTEFTVGVYSLIGLGVVSKVLSNYNYSNYLNAQSNLDIDKYYTQANNLHKGAFVFIGTGSLLWATEIVLATVKGIKNTKISPSFIEYGLNYDANTKFSTINFTLKF